MTTFDPNTFLLFALIVWLISIVLSTALGADKGRGAQGFVLGLLLSWIGLLIVWLLPVREKQPREESSSWLDDLRESTIPTVEAPENLQP